MFGSSDRAQVENLVDGLFRPDRLAGLILRDGDPCGTPFAENPWDIPASATLDDAVTRVWAGVAGRAPGFVRSLRRRLLGLALCECDVRGTFLGYLLYGEFFRYEIGEGLVDAPRPPFDRRHAASWAPFGDVVGFVGYAPAGGHHMLPAPLRALYAVHAGMTDGAWSLARPAHVTPFSETFGHEEPTAIRTEDHDELYFSSDLLAFFYYGDDRADLLAVDNDPDDPPVRAWGDGMLYAGGGEPFWAWFDDLTDMLLARPEEC